MALDVNMVGVGLFKRAGKPTHSIRWVTGGFNQVGSQVSGLGFINIQVFRRVTGLIDFLPNNLTRLTIQLDTVLHMALFNREHRFPFTHVIPPNPHPHLLSDNFFHPKKKLSHQEIQPHTVTPMPPHNQASYKGLHLSHTGVAAPVLFPLLAELRRTPQLLLASIYSLFLFSYDFSESSDLLHLYNFKVFWLSDCFFQYFMS